METHCGHQLTSRKSKEFEVSGHLEGQPTQLKGVWGEAIDCPFLRHCGQFTAWPIGQEPTTIAVQRIEGRAISYSKQTILALGI